MELLIRNKYAGIILYTVALVVYMFAIKGSADIAKYPKRDSIDENLKKLGQFRLHFFTIWNFAWQLFFVVTAILDEFFKLLNLPVSIQKRLSRTRAWVFNTFVFPSSLLVTTIFWSIWHVDRELIFPKAIDEFYPLWLNHSMHTFIVVPLIMEVLLPKKYNFVEFKNASVVLLVYLSVYQILYMSVYLRYGVWLYPIYKVLNWPQRIIYTLLQMMVCLLYQKIGITLQNRKKLKYQAKIN